MARRLGEIALLGVLLLPVVSVTPPHHNWDMLAYVGVAYAYLGIGGGELHERVYAGARETVSPERYELLTGADAYRRETAASPEAFSQQLPFYAVKPAYPAAIALLAGLGMNAFDASVLISRIAVVAIGLVTFLWLAGRMPAPAALAVAWLAVSLRFVIDLAGASTPDALSTAVVLSALWLLSRRRARAAGLILATSVLVRPDNVIWLLLLAGYHLWLGEGRGRESLAWLAAGVLAYGGVTLASGHYGWRVLFSTSFVERLAYPADATVHLPLLQVFEIYLRRSHPANLPPHFLLMLLAGGTLLVARARALGTRHRENAMLAMALAQPLLHWLVYPDEQRFMVAAYLLVLVFLTGHLAAAATRTAGAAHP